MKVQKSAAWAAALVGTLVLAGCSNSTDNAAADGDHTVAFVCAQPDIPFFAPLQKGAEEAADAEGVTLNYTGISASEVTPGAMANLLQAAINKKPDALIACNFFPDTERPLFEEAIAAGIPVYVVEGGEEDLELGATSAFGMNNEEAGSRAGEELVKQAPDAENVLCVNQLPEDPLVSARCVGLTKSLEAEGVEVATLNLSNANTNQTRFVDAVQSALTSGKDIDVVVALGARQGEGVVKAAAAAGRDDIKIATFDVSENVLKSIEEGETLFAVWQQPYLNGYLSVVSAALFAKYGMSPPSVVQTGPLFISKDTLGTIAAAREAGLL